jgi:hypothetical protein
MKTCIALSREMKNEKLKIKNDHSAKPAYLLPQTSSHLFFQTRGTSHCVELKIENAKLKIGHSAQLSSPSSPSSPRRLIIPILSAE